MPSADIDYQTRLGPPDAVLLSEITALARQLFDTDSLDCHWRLGRMPEVSVFCAWGGSRLIGFKAGYAMSQHKYYSWLGGVLAPYRGRGIAVALARQQHDWASARGFERIETSSRQHNTAMARVNLRLGFDLIGTRQEPHGLQLLWGKLLG